MKLPLQHVLSLAVPVLFVLWEGPTITSGAVHAHSDGSSWGQLSSGAETTNLPEVLPPRLC